MTIILTPHLLESVIIFFREDKLKCKLKGLYPQLIFDKPARRNLSRVVNNTKIRLVGTRAELHLGAIQSSSETSTESNLFTQGLASSQLQSPARGMLYSGIALCNSLYSCLSNCRRTYWPGVSIKEKFISQWIEEYSSNAKSRFFIQGSIAVL